MQQPSSYCAAVRHYEPGHVHRVYHDTAYGFPLTDDNELFGRLLLEINQAGLSWTTILQKQAHFRNAYNGFRIAEVADFGPKDVERLLGDAGIIRNRLKIHAAIHNAQVIRDLQQQHGSFLQWLHAHHPLPKTDWVKVFKKQFKFTGGEIVNEFLVSTGFLPGAHDESCPVYKKVLRLKPAWTKA